MKPVCGFHICKLCGKSPTTTVTIYALKKPNSNHDINYRKLGIFVYCCLCPSFAVLLFFLFSHHLGIFVSLVLDFLKHSCNVHCSKISNKRYFFLFVCFSSVRYSKEINVIIKYIKSPLRRSDFLAFQNDSYIHGTINLKPGCDSFCKVLYYFDSEYVLKFMCYIIYALLCCHKLTLNIIIKMY